MPGWRVSDLEKEVVPMALDFWGWLPAVKPLLEFWVFTHPIKPGFYLFVGHFLSALAESRCYSPVAPSLRHGAAIVWAWLHARHTLLPGSSPKNGSPIWGGGVYKLRPLLPPQNQPTLHRVYLYTPKTPFPETLLELVPVSVQEDLKRPRFVGSASFE